MPLPVVYPIPVYTGQTEPVVVRWTADGAAVNLTGYSATFAVWTQARALIDTATAGSGASATLGITLALGGTAGTATVTLPHTLAAALAAYGPCEYDLIVVSGGGVPTALARGPIQVTTGRPTA